VIARVWIDHSPRPGWQNMALDAAMLDRADRAGEILIRAYRWAPHCLSFGRHEPARRRYDTARIAALGLDCVRRPTGGRAVWHARELTYAVAAPLAAFGGARAAYPEIHRWLAAAVERLGLAASLAPPRTVPGVGAGPCFAAPVGGEVLVQGRKVAGSAQRRLGSAFLQHGSLLLEDDQSLIRSLAVGAGPAHDAGDAALASLLDRPMPFDEAARALAAVLVSQGLPDAGNGAPEDVAEPAALHYERYRSDHWTWER
jgi:lipoate-protein ligase A